MRVHDRRLATRLVRCGLFTALLALTPPVPLFATDFDFGVDRFEIDGNRFGAADGTPDVVEEFDASVWNWMTINGTVFAGGGLLHLASPGSVVADGFGALPGTALEISMAQMPQVVALGGGGFTARSYWPPMSLRVGDFVHFSMVASAIDATTGAFVFEVVGVAISNATPDDLPTRYDVTQVAVRLAAGNATEPLQEERVSLDPAEVTGDVVLALSDDGTGMLQTSFSVDGGATFQTPFQPRAFFRASPLGYFLLGADPLAAGESRSRPFCPGGPAAIARSRLRLRTGGARRPVTHGTIRVAVPDTYDPARDGVQLAIRDPAAPDTAVLDLTRDKAVPAGSPGGGCAPRDGWTRRGAVSRYRNVSGALPPSCTPGSADGLARLVIDRRRDRVAFHIRRPSLLAGGRVTATVAFGATGEAVAAGRCASVDAACTDTGRTLRCR